MRLTYAKCVELLKGKSRKKLAGNTYLREAAFGVMAVTFHNTPILNLWANGLVTLSSGGFRTATTKARLSEFGPVNVWQEKGQWYCGGNGVRWPFKDGIEFHVDGGIVSLSESTPITTHPDEKALVEAYNRGDCPAGVVTDWRKDNSVVVA